MYELNNKNGQLKIIHSLTDGQGIRITKKFLEKIVLKIAKNSGKQLEGEGLPPPFAYREKQFHTVMAPALSEICDFYLMESPVNRNWSGSENQQENDSHGWVDYWCDYHNFNYYIELKHGFISYISNDIRQSERKKWKNACQQLDVLNDEIETQKSFTEGIFKVVFHVMPIYLNSSQEEKLEKKAIEIEKFQKEIMVGISEEYPSNWSCLWTLDDKIDKIHEFANGYERYPAVLFLARVFDIEK